MLSFGGCNKSKSVAAKDKGANLLAVLRMLHSEAISISSSGENKYYMRFVLSWLTLQCFLIVFL
jgi:hypothetical protein